MLIKHMYVILLSEKLHNIEQINFETRLSYCSIPPSKLNVGII